MANRIWSSLFRNIFTLLLPTFLNKFSRRSLSNNEWGWCVIFSSIYTFIVPYQCLWYAFRLWSFVNSSFNVICHLIKCHFRFWLLFLEETQIGSIHSDSRNHLCNRQLFYHIGVGYIFWFFSSSSTYYISRNKWIKKKRPLVHRSGLRFRISDFKSNTRYIVARLDYYFLLFFFNWNYCCPLKIVDD